MPYQNIDATLTDADRDQILLKLDEVKTLLPFLVNLTERDKKGQLKLGNQTEKFFVDVLKILNINPIYKPPFVDDQGYGTDLNLYITLLMVEAKIKGLVESIADTRFALAQEMMTPALAVYRSVQTAARANVPGSDTVLNELKPYFKKTRKKKE
jgi:hypothetical protein